jgi:hypothetical protein
MNKGRCLLGVLITLGVIVGLKNLPDFIRYMKIRAM